MRLLTFGWRGRPLHPAAVLDQAAAWIQLIRHLIETAATEAGDPRWTDALDRLDRAAAALRGR